MAARAQRRRARSIPRAPSLSAPTPEPAALPSAVPHGLRAHLLLSLATLATFARAVPYPLQLRWDDGRFIVDNPDVRAPSWHALGAIFGGVRFEAYHPLHLLSYWLDVPWSGASAPVLHAVSLVLWVIAANLLLRVMLALGLSPASAALGSAACVLHPVQVEAVSWATGRKDVLALLLACACMLLHLRARHWLDRDAWLARGAYVLAALAKTTTLPLPAVLWLADVALRRRPPREAALHQLPSLALGAGAGVFVVRLWGEQHMLRQHAGAGPLARVVATSAHQLATALWPSATSPMYSTRAVLEPAPWAFALCAALVLAAFAAWRLRAGRALFALGAFALLLSPVSNAVPMYFPYQDRYLSLPLLALGFGLGAALDALERVAPRAALPLGAALVLALALRCVQYQGAWRSETRLWGHAASTQPDAYYAWMKLGEVRRAAHDLYGAIRAYRTLLRVDPGAKMGHAALFEAVALRDEQLRALAPSRAEAYAKEYYDTLDDAGALRALAARLLQVGYLRLPELPLDRSLLLQPFPDDALQHAARVQLAERRPGLALCYLRHLSHEGLSPALRQQAEQARAELPFELP